MSLFQRIKTPFTDFSEDQEVLPRARIPSVGAVLRARRAELALDLGSIGEVLRIKPVYLAALEEGRTEDLPGPTYAVGFVRAYADYLGLDSERVLERYKAESAGVQARPDLSLPVPLGARSLPGGPILMVAAILALCGYGTWYYLSTGERSRPERVSAVPAELQRQIAPTPSGAAAAAPPTTAAPVAGPTKSQAAAKPRFASGILGASDLPGAPDTAAPATPPPALVATPAVAALPAPAAANAPTVAAPSVMPAPANPPPAIAQPTNAAPANPQQIAEPVKAVAVAPGDAAKPGAGIDIRALADCWIQVRAADDQAIVFSRVLKAGETYHVPRGGLFLRTGNAGALAIAVDGKPAPAIGGIGTLRRNVSLDADALLAGTAVRG